MKKVTVGLLACFILAFSMFAADITAKKEKRIYFTKRINRPPVLDGRLTDAVWETVEWSGDFIQRQPYEGQKPSQETAFKILYDDKNLYVAIRAFDKEPEKVEKRLSRRDYFAGDWVEINIDSYFDHRTAFSFTVNAAGVKGDEAISNNGDTWDSDWNPIWYVKTKNDQQGWTAEMKIPFSQLRYGKKEKQIWGLQFNRRLFRKDERSSWQYITQDAPGWVHLFGELHGIEDIKSQRPMELYPYVVGKHQRFEKEEGNPFATGVSSQLSGGLDGKIGVTSDLTLDFTINPDFGQVEADPSEVNLTAFETYFVEKRPFFIEGKSILNFQITSGDGSFSNDNLFYSRRVGRPPQYGPNTVNNEYIDIPESTRILGAFKLTGKTKKGLSVAALESLTAKENATFDYLGQRHEQTVEPLTNYFALRLQQDLRNGDTRIGGMFTAVNRKIDEPTLDFLHRAAYTGGLDFFHTWKEKTYYVMLNTVFSHVRGSKEALLETQQSSRRYYQRPDADYVEVDPDRTSLSGHGGTFAVGKDGKGHFRYSGGVTWRSPGLELNDMGYLYRADRTMQWIWVGYRIWKPNTVFRRLSMNFNQYQGWDFGGNQLFNGGNINGYTQFKNYWELGFGIEGELAAITNSELRGGPALKVPGGWSNWFEINSDSRKKIIFSLVGSHYWGNHQSVRQKEYQFGMTFHPTNALSIKLVPSIAWNKHQLQYVDTIEFQTEPRYLYAFIDQKTVSVTIRLDLSLTPELTLQFYGQPFLSAGKYSQFKRISNPRAERYSDRFHIYGDNEISYEAGDNVLHFDENADGNIDYSMHHPNFNFLQFRSNLVLRWEYKPGSILYLVWSQGRTGEDISGEFSFGRGMRDLFRVTPHDVFLIKFTHRFNI
jgi:hypothetical protein